MPTPDTCDCQLPGYFRSGVPGILAHMANCQAVPGAIVERCDLCERYPTDQAATEQLQALNMIRREEGAV